VVTWLALLASHSAYSLLIPWPRYRLNRMKIFMFFFSYSLQIPGSYLSVGQNLFLPRLLEAIILIFKSFFQAAPTTGGGVKSLQINGARVSGGLGFEYFAYFFVSRQYHYSPTVQFNPFITQTPVTFSDLVLHIFSRSAIVWGSEKNCSPES
jgi:hypothetical protein